MNKREQQISEIEAELKMKNLTASRRKDLNGLLKEARRLLAMGR